MSAAVIAALGCSSKPAKAPEFVESGNPKAANVPQGPSIEAKQVAGQELAAFVSEQKFQRGRADVTPAMKKDFTRLLEKAKAQGKVDEVKLVAWADQDYPAEAKKELPKAQQKLADRRLESLKKYVESVDKDLNVTTHSMAERPGRWDEMFSTSDERVKKAFEDAGIPQAGVKGKGMSKASKAVVMISVGDK